LEIRQVCCNDKSLLNCGVKSYAPNTLHATLSLRTFT